MRNKKVTRDFYVNELGFTVFGRYDYDGYLMVEKDAIQIHFFLYEDLNPKENYGQVYIRTDQIDAVYDQFVKQGVSVSALENKPWQQREFSILDPDHNLLTFGQSS